MTYLGWNPDAHAKAIRDLIGSGKLKGGREARLEDHGNEEQVYKNGAPPSATTEGPKGDEAGPYRKEIPGGH